MKPVEPILEQRRELKRTERGQLFRKYFLLILGLVLGALLISGAIGLYFSYQENKGALASLQREKAISAAARIEQYIRQIEQQLSFAALPQLGAQGLEQRRIEFHKLQRMVHAITELFQLDGQGREQLTVSRLAIEAIGSQRDRSQETAFREAKPGQTWFGPVYFRKETEPYMQIAVRSERALTVAEINLKFILDVVSRIQIGGKGKAYVVDRTGHLVADPDIGLVLRKTDLSKLAHVAAALRDPGTDLRSSQASDLSGTPVLSAYSPIESLGWLVFVEQPVSEVYATLNAAILRTVGLIVAGLLFSVLAALWLARSMVRPIRTLQEGAQRIGAGDLEQRIQIKTGDELEALAEQFNEMSTRLRESYAGLEKKVEERTAELTQALQFQEASGEILSSISGSIADTRPVFDAIVRNLLRLFGTRFANVQLLRDGRVEMGAVQGDPGFERLAERYPRPFDDDTIGGIVMRSGEVFQMSPVIGNPDAPRGTAEFARDFGFDSVIGAPMVREGKVIGAVITARHEAVPFDDKQVALLKTFADQAVIAIENARLVNETREALEQQTTTAEILKVISSSPTDVQPVFEAIAQSGVRLFEGAAVTVALPQEGEVRLAAIAEGDPERAESWKKRFPFPLSREYMHAAAILDRKLVEVPDALAADRSEWSAGIRNFLATGYRALTIVPMLRGDAAIGAISVIRPEPGALSDKQLALLRTFADQAVIAIENVRLFNETREALERQTAVRKVLESISQAVFDLDSVLRTLIESATRLCRADRGFIFRMEGGLLRATVDFNVTDEYREFLRANPLEPAPGTLVGRTALEARTVHIRDAATDPQYRWRESQQLGGFHTMLGVPMIREGQVIGVIAMWKERVEPFTPEQIDLVTTFSNQALIAIENVRLFKEIQEKSTQLEIANRHKSEFLANMSHELRTPLNAIIGFSEVMLERLFGELNEKQADYTKDIHESGKHLLSLINDILDLSKIEAGRMDLEVAAFDLPSALSNALTLVRERAQRHGIALSLLVDPQLSEIHADERKVKQILLNLLSNAVKFTPDGGKVDVTARIVNADVEIAVRDTGIGIAPEDQAAVFEEFKQVGRDYTRKAEGTGLGLALTKRFVELHGGAVRLESEPGKGSTFTFTLPLAAGEIPLSARQT